MPPIIARHFARGRHRAGAQNVCGKRQGPGRFLPRPRQCRMVFRVGSDRFFEFLGGTEGDLLAGLDLDGGAGRRITAHARGALADLQDA